MSTRESLQTEGLVKLEASADSEFTDLINSLGEAWCETVVQLRPGVQSYLCNPDPVPFHTDHPKADWIAWRCEHEAAGEGSLWLLDGWGILERCSRSTQAKLEQIHFEARSRPGEQAVTAPLLRYDLGVPRLFFADGFAPVCQGADLESAMNDFRAALRLQASHATRRFEMKAGEALIVDNTRFLHGRGRLSLNSPRRLRRFWVTKK